MSGRSRKSSITSLETETLKLPRVPNSPNGSLVAANHTGPESRDSAKWPTGPSKETEKRQRSSQKLRDKGSPNPNHKDDKMSKLLPQFSAIGNELGSHVEGESGDSLSDCGQEDGNPAKHVFFTSPIGREFTFTGYDMMTDVDHQKLAEETAREVLNRKNKEKYEGACRRYGVIPVGSISKKLNDRKLCLRHRSLGQAGAKALAATLVKNKVVDTLCLEHTNLRAGGVSALCELIKVNFNITELNITGNNIGTDGIRVLAGTLARHDYLRKLNLSDNGLKDQDAEFIFDILGNNDVLLELVISRNELGEIGGDAIGAALEMNDTLQLLDLSWNHIRGQGAIAIAEGVRRNSSLTHLNVSWNGFGLDGAEALAIALSKNSSLSFLDLTCNRLHGEAIGAILKGYRLNSSLVTLKLAKNPFPPQVATIIIRIVMKHEQSQLEVLDLSDIVIDDECYDKIEKLRFIRDITVTHGPLIKKKELLKHDKSAIVDQDPRKVLFDFMAREGMRVLDLFKRLDTDGSNSVSRDEFKAGLISVDAPLTTSQLDDLVTVLDADGDGEVDLGELQGGEKIYRRQVFTKKLKEQEQLKVLEKLQKLGKDSAATSRFKKKP